MRKLIKNKTEVQYLSFLAGLPTPIESAKAKTSNTTDTRSDYKTLRANGDFRDMVMDVQNDFCPYCEINSIDKGKSRFEVDHIKPKSMYKELSIVWDNIIPACHSCNHNKGNSEDVLNPLTNDYDQIDFEFLPTIDNFDRVAIVSNDAATIISNEKLELQDFYNSRIPQIKLQIELIQNTAMLSRPIDKFIGFNCEYGRLLEIYSAKFGF